MRHDAMRTGRAFGVVVARVRVRWTRRRRSLFMYAVVVVVVACGGTRWVRTMRGTVVVVTWRDEASTMRRHHHVSTSVEGEVGEGEALLSC